MEPYYQDEHCTIYHGDCLTVLCGLPEQSIDCVITDPPFSSGSRTEAGRSLRGSMVRGARWQDDWFSHDNLATHGFLCLMRLLFVELFRVSKMPAAAHVFIDWRMYPHLFGTAEAANWTVKNLVVWDKEHFGMGTTYRNQHELIVYAEKGSIEFSERGVGNVLRAKRAKCDWHPTEKPTDLLRRMVRATTKNGSVVLDTFMGSGSTLRAAVDEGRKAVGIEIEERYCEIAANRLRQQVLF